MMFYQRQKHMGKSTSDEMQKEDILKKFMSEEYVKRLRHELENNSSSNNSLQEKLGSAKKKISGRKSKLEKEKREVLKMQGCLTMYKENLAEREREIRAMREMLSNANHLVI